MPLKFQYPELYIQAQQNNISLGRASNSGDWDMSLETYLTQNSLEQSQELMQYMQTIIIEEDTQDVIMWKWETSKNFSVKSFYRGMEQYPAIDDIRAKSCDIKAPPRVMIFIWLMLRNKIVSDKFHLT